MPKKKPTSSEIDRSTWIERMQAEKAATLSAALALVEMKDKPRYGRPPKKIGTIVVKTGITNGYRDETATFTLRLDGSDFIAEHGDVWYVSKSRDALKLKMEEVAKVALDLKWTRYIALEYEAFTTHERGSWSYSDRELSVGERRKKADKIHGLRLKWGIVEYSNAIRLPGDDDQERHMKRDVGETGTPDEKQTTVTKLPDGLVPHTPAREALLRQIIEALTKLDAKLVEMFRGSPDDVGRAIDERIGVAFMLTDGKAPQS